MAAELDDAAVADDEEDVEESGAVSWLALITQLLSELQEYPNGQHPVPHVGSVPVSAVVMSEMSGCAVAFCCVISHVMDLITEQELPDGQHNTVVLAASTTQSEEGPQQKLDGSPA